MDILNMKSKKIKECFGNLGGSILMGEPPEECVACELIDRCYQVTVAMALQGMALDFNLLIQNGMSKGWLKSFSELDPKGPHLDEFDDREN